MQGHKPHLLVCVFVMLMTRHRRGYRLSAAARWAVYCALALLIQTLAGCVQASDQERSADRAVAFQLADVGRVDVALQETPCALLTTARVASIFALPMEQIKQSQLLSRCDYVWRGGGRRFAVSLEIAGIFDDAMCASSWFHAATRDTLVVRQSHLVAASRGAAGEQFAGIGHHNAHLADSSNRAAIAFENIDSVGDEARVLLTQGAADLYVRIGNMNLVVSAYIDPVMPSVVSADARAQLESLRQQTWPLRKLLATKIARAAIAAL